MRKINIFSLLILVVILGISTLNAQNFPSGIAYQAVALKDSLTIKSSLDGNIYYSNQGIKVRIGIFDDYPIGNLEFQETHQLVTDKYGVFNFIIGKGNVVSGNFDKINWDLGKAHLKVEIDYSNNGSYQLVSIEKFWSVPYALSTPDSKRISNLSSRDKDTVLGNEFQSLKLNGDSLNISNGNSVQLPYIAKADSLRFTQKIIKNKKSIDLSRGGGSVLLLDDDSTNEIQHLSYKNDTLSLSKSGVKIAIQNPLQAMEDAMGCIFVHRFCSGDGSISNPWKSRDSSAGIFQALGNLTPTKRILYFKPGFYFTTGALNVDFSKYLPNLSNANWKNAFSGMGIEFQGHNAAFYINNGVALNSGKPGILFNWKGENAFYWKFNGLQFYGVVDTALVQFGNGYEFPLNGCEFDIVGNNGYVPKNYKTTISRASAIKICFPLESKLHLVGVSATGNGVDLETASFCTINGAFSNTIIPNTNTIYPNSYGLRLKNCQSNAFTHMDLEICHSGIKFDEWSIQNTFSAIFVSLGDTNGATFDVSNQHTTGKNVVISIRSGGTVQTPSKPLVQKMFLKPSDSDKIKVDNYYGF